MTSITSKRTDPNLGSEKPKGYYGIPAIHRPHWKWLIVGYFFFGGISGSSAAISALARVFGGPRATRLARVATCVSIAALAPCPALLILDLGRPKRFLNMLRAFRPSSPMSMGTWGLGAFSTLLALDAAFHLLSNVQETSASTFPRPSRVVQQSVAILAGAGGLFVAGYTGVLLAATAVPLWSKRPALLGPLFLSSAFSSGGAAVSAIAALTGGLNSESEEALQRFETIVALTEGTLLVAWLASLGTTARPLQQGLLGYVVRDGVGAVGIAAPLAVNAVSPFLPHRFRRAASLVGAAFTLAGVFALRFAVVEGGRQSADDPMATFDMTG